MLIRQNETANHSKRDNNIMSSLMKHLIFVNLLSSVVNADNPRALHGLEDRRRIEICQRMISFKGENRRLPCYCEPCPSGYRCDIRSGGCVKISTPPPTKRCTCESNKLIVEGGSYVPTMEACQQKCQHLRSCKVRIVIARCQKMKHLKNISVLHLQSQNLHLWP